MAYKRKDKPGCMVYWDMWDVLEYLQPEQTHELCRAIRKYSQHGELPTFSDNSLNLVWFTIKDKLDKDDTRYKGISKQKQIAGYTSTFKRVYAPKHGIDPDDEEALKVYIEQQMSTGVD